MRKSKIKVVVLIILVIVMIGLFLKRMVIKKNPADEATSLMSIQASSLKDFDQIDQAIREILEFEKDGESLTIDDSLNHVNWAQVRDPFSFSSARRPIDDREKGKMIKSGPQKPKELTKPELPKIHLEGIIFDKKSPMAIIDGEVYRVGDVIKGFRISEISKSGVRLKSPNDQIILKAPEIE
ncbi:MAG: hypothetical protein COT43_10705 [Candidatus Marinimicrobia bacterium CG08_land_8_20_14_0_20_45_22]|nr:MAG: hypothetical protein COT43_10705 [Candidatus Marinimicrobia bacterium CG08_land_8_20_14_0_20_45_22]